MKVLSVGSDRGLFEPSEVLNRVREYSKKVELYTVVVFSKKSLGLKSFESSNLRVYPTDSINKLMYVLDAIFISKKILNAESDHKDWVTTTQDPFESALVGYIIKLLYGIPLNIQVHTDFLSSHFRSTLLNKIRSVLGRFLIHKADSIRVVSTVIKDSIIDKYPKLDKKISTMPIFVDIKSILDFVPLKDIKKDYPNYEFTIMMASRLSPEKRIDLALKAMKTILDKFPKTGLVICGSGSEMDNLIKMTEDLGIQKSVNFIGWQKDLISYYKTADIYLLTSEYEGYGMTLIEAGASGIPIVTTRVGLAKTDLFKDGINTSICGSMTSSSVAEAVMVLITDNSRRLSYSQNIKSSISTLISSREEYIEKYIDILSDSPKKE